MASTERAFNLIDVKKEKINKFNEKLEINNGSLEFKDVSMRYRAETELVLKKVSFKIEDG